MISPATAAHARLALTLASLILFNTFQAKAQQALPAGPDVYTQAKFNKQYLAYELRILDSYDKHTADPPKLRKAAHDLLTHDRRLAIGMAGKRMRGSLYKPGLQLLEQGSKDPLILNATAVAAYYHRVKSDETLDLLRRADEALTKSSYPARERALVITRTYAFRFKIVQLDRKLKRKPKLDKRPPVEAIARWIIAERKAKDDQRFLWHSVQRMFNFKHPRFLVPLSPKLLAELVEQQKDGDLWMLNMLKGYYVARRTWPHHNAPPGPGQRKFRTDMTRVAGHFVAAWKHNPRFPEPAAELINIARQGLNEQTPRFWFDQTVAAQLDYAAAYTNLRTALRPSRGGSIEAMFKFGRECARTKRFDTRVPFELLESLHAIENVLGNDAQIWRRQGVYDDVYQLCDRAIASPTYMNQPQTDATRNWMRATQIAIGARAQRYKEIVPLFGKVDEFSLRRALRMYHVTTPAPMLRAMAEAASGDGRLVIEAEVAIEQVKDVATAREAQVKLAAAAEKSSKQGQAWCDYWRRALQQYEGFYSGEWVDVTFPDQLPRMTGVKQWKVEGERTLVSTGSEPLRLESLSRLNPPFELTIDIETKLMAPETKLAGVLLGYGRPIPNRPLGRLFGLNSQIGWTGAPRSAGPPMVAAKLKKVNHMHVRAWWGHYELYVNGLRIAASPDNLFSPAGNFVFWTPGNRNTKVLVRYSNLRIRRLAYEFPPDVKVYDDRVEYYTLTVKYYTQRIADAPKDVFAYLDRADAYLALHENTNALVDYQLVLELGKDWADVHVKVGITLAALGEYEKALSKYQQALAKEAYNALALNRLAWLEATCPDKKFRDGAKAFKHATRAYEISRMDKDYLIALSAAHAENGYFVDAIKLMKRRGKFPFSDKRVQGLLDKMTAAFENKQPFRDAIGEIAPRPTAAGNSFAGVRAGQEWDGNDLKMKFCWCPPGRFTMGSPKIEPGRRSDEDQVAVTLTRGFWLGKYEVTQSQWKAVMETQPWAGNRYVKTGDDYPATHASWEDAVKFCSQLTKKEKAAGRLPSDWEYRLPTEAQWEYACRAGSKNQYSFDDDSRLGDYAWFSGNARNVKTMYAHLVGTKLANAWGLHDMHGNLWEWCQDWYQAKLPGGKDPEATAAGSRRVARGGCWYYNAKSSRCGYRSTAKPGYRSFTIGFRVAAVPSLRPRENPGLNPASPK